jgi:hypothetical protein
MVRNFENKMTATLEIEEGRRVHFHIFMVRKNRTTTTGLKLQKGTAHFSYWTVLLKTLRSPSLGMMGHVTGMLHGKKYSLLNKGPGMSD